MIQTIIDDFNTMLAGLVATPAFAGVRYIDLRRTLPNTLPGNVYQQWWANELHPSSNGWSAVAAKFQAVLNTIP